MSGPSAFTASVALPEPLRALTDTLRPVALIDGVTSGSASLKLTDAAPSVSLAFELTLAFTVSVAVAVVRGRRVHRGKADDDARRQQDPNGGLHGRRLLRDTFRPAEVGTVSSP